MNSRALGSTGLRISEVAFGGVEIGMPYGISSGGRMPTADEAIYLLHASLDAGINFYDTARMYGNSERIMGRAFRDRRDRVVLSTKCCHFRDANGNLPSDAALKEIIQGSVSQSLHALQTDYVDVLMLHQVDREVLSNDVIAHEFAELKHKGIARAIGVSTYHVDETAAAIGSGLWDVVQLPFNLMDQRQQPLFKAAEEAGVGVVVRSVLLKKLLSDRAADLHSSLQRVKDHIACYDEILSGNMFPLSTLALKFAMSFSEVSTVLVGLDRLEYLQQALAAANGEYLEGAIFERAKALAFPDPEFLDLPHWAKMGWLL